jgi:hypothetical protein
MESDVMCGYPPSMSIFSLPDDNGSMSPVRYLVFDKIQWQDELVEHSQIAFFSGCPLQPLNKLVPNNIMEPIIVHRI